MNEQQDETTEKTEGIKTVTLAEQGPILPIGTLDQDSNLVKAFTTRNWTFKQERVLGERRRDMGSEGDNMARYVSAVLATMCPQLGAHDFSRDEERELNEIRVGQMWLPDVMYAYVYLRYKALGHELPMTLTSPYTKKEFKWSGDLTTLSIKVPSTPEDAYWDYELRDPFEIRGKLATSFKMGPQRWNVAEQLNPGNSTDATAKAAAIRSSIHGVAGLPPLALIDEDLDDMTKRDIEGLASAIDVNGVGPIMVLDVEDPTVEVSAGGKRRTFHQQVDWRYDNFFAISSQ